MSVQTRLAELRRELAEGERALAELDQRRERLVASMLRIGGAVQVLEELAAAETAEAADAADDVGSLDVDATSVGV